MRRYTLIISFMFAFGVLNAQKSLERKLLQAIKNEQAFEGAQVSVTVFDLKQNKKRVSIQSDKNILPASALKLVVFLGARSTFDSEIPILHFKKEANRFYFWSTGYPLAAHPKYEADEIFDFLKSQKDSLYYIPRPMTSPELGSGWAWDDVSYAFSAKKSSFPIHGNLMQVMVDPSADSLYVDPEVLETQITVKKKEEFYEILAEEHLYRLSRKEKDSLYIPFTPSEFLFEAIFEEKLGRQIHVDRQNNKAPIDFQTLTTTKKTIYKALLHDSDNLVAESLLLMLSETEQWELNTRRGIDFLNSKLNVFSNTIQQVDGSGLSRYNLLRPLDLIALLEVLYYKEGEKEIKHYFPQANTNGTLESYAKQMPLGFVYAKSGSLLNNHILAGYLFSKSQRPYSFVISVNNYLANKSRIRESIGNQLQLIYRKLR